MVRSGPQEAISSAVISAPSVKSQTSPSWIAFISCCSAVQYWSLSAPMFRHCALWHRTRRRGGDRHRGICR